MVLLLLLLVLLILLHLFLLLLFLLLLAVWQRPAHRVRQLLLLLHFFQLFPLR